MTVSRGVKHGFVVLLVLVLLVSAGAVGAAASSSVLVDKSGGFKLGSTTAPSSVASTTKNVVTIIYSPGVPSLFVDDDEDSSSSLLSLRDDDGVVLCQGATLNSNDLSVGERTALATASLVSNSIIVDGITIGDVEAGVSHQTRHSRTVNILFRSKLAAIAASEDGEANNNARQTLIFAIKSSSEDDVGTDVESTIMEGLQTTFDALAVESGLKSVSIDNLYDIKIVSVSSNGEAKEVLDSAKTAASESSSSGTTLATALKDASGRIKETKLSSIDVTTPQTAQAMVAIVNSHAKQSKYARAKIAGWKSRATRGLWTDGFGADAEAVRRRVLASFDSETLAGAGIAQVAPYRMEQRNQLASLIDTAIAEVYELQAMNLQKRTLKKFRAQLLKKLDVTPPEDVPSENAAATRAALLSFDNIMSDLEVPSLSLTKVRPNQDMESQLMDAASTFDDSSEAKIKRQKKVDTVAKKEKQPGQRSVDFGLDLVAVVRPDGYGSLQGYAGYQMGGSNFIFGIHNDADDPQVIAQFGGVRPPLIRIQPKLRVDVEM